MPTYHQKLETPNFANATAFYVALRSLKRRFADELTALLAEHLPAVATTRQGTPAALYRGRDGKIHNVALLCYSTPFGRYGRPDGGPWVVRVHHDDLAIRIPKALAKRLDGRPIVAHFEGDSWELTLLPVELPSMTAWIARRILAAEGIGELPLPPVPLTSPGPPSHYDWTQAAHGPYFAWRAARKEAR